MNDVLSTLRDELVSATANGQPLEAFQGSVHVDADAMGFGASTRWPLMILRPAPAVVVDQARGSRFVVQQGTIFVSMYEPIDDGNSPVAARQACDTHRENLERVLLGLRTKTTNAHPTGCWSRMRFELAEAGGGMGTGPFDLHGIECYRAVYALDFRFARERAA